MSKNSKNVISRDEKSSEHGSSDMNGGSPSLANNVTDPDRDAKLREIVSHIYQYVSRQYGLRQMTQQSGVSNFWISHCFQAFVELFETYSL